MNSELTKLLSQGKNSGLHWFPEGVAISTLAATLVGMANTEGGTVLLGISPRSAEIIGLSDPQAAIDHVFQAALLAEPVLVLPIPRIIQVQHDEQIQEILWITVPAGLPQVYMLDGRYLGREGSQTNPLSARRLRQLLSERWEEAFEAQVPPDTWLEDLDSDQVVDYFRQLHDGEEGDLDQAYQFLFRRGCLQREDHIMRPTYAALLLFGRYPQQYLSQSTILAAQFPDTSMSDMFIKKELTGNLPSQLHQAEAFVRANLGIMVRMLGLVREEIPVIPLEAIREILVNAVAHRDYSIQGDNIHLYIFSDRLEIYSPGELPGPVTIENLLDARFSRNPILVQVLSDLGFVERLGYGLKRVVKVMQKAGLRPPRFDEIGGSFRVTLYNQLESGSQRRVSEDQLPVEILQDSSFNLRQRLALGHLAREKRITSRAYQELCPDVHAETLRRDLVDLVDRGILIKVGDKKSTYYILKKPFSR